ncbi:MULTISPECIES: hypothetical protein [unclassified Neomoorella]|uniref:hypothetical protein n=1 Tax=unclassified Neomoorella TaxID=2676739 RepID=UPI001C0F38CD|nr:MULTISPECIES: hypothetical protein [unclassified Moorella (in: firmicutes)]
MHTAAATTPTHGLNLASRLKTITSVALAAIMNGVTGWASGGTMPRMRAIHGVRAPMTTPPPMPTVKVARNSIAFTSGPVTGCGSPTIWTATVRASSRAVVVRNLVFRHMTYLASSGFSGCVPFSAKRLQQRLHFIPHVPLLPRGQADRDQEALLLPIPKNALGNTEDAGYRAGQQEFVVVNGHGSSLLQCFYSTGFCLFPTWGGKF